MDTVTLTSIAHGKGPFVSWVVRVAEDDTHTLQTSRRSRKRLAPVPVPGPQHPPLDATEHIGHNWLRLYAPERLGWWIAILFMIGSACFAIAGARAAWPDMAALSGLPAPLINPVFFVGSLFFTSAAGLQLYESMNTDEEIPGDRARILQWRPRNLGYLASLVQFVGTLLFNVNTFDAMITGLGWQAEDLLVWIPDIVGCLCFLAASQLAVMEFAHSWVTVRPRQLAWWIVAINMLGSVLFMVSGVASVSLPGGTLLDPFTANAGTFGGAVCFLLGAYLLIPEQFETTGAPGTAQPKAA